MKQQARQAEFAQTEARMREVLAELQSQFPDRQNPQPASEELRNHDENPAKPAVTGQAGARAWPVLEWVRLVGRMLVAGMILAAVWWPLSFFWDQVRLWRDNEGKIHVRYWLIWPRTRTITATANTRLQIQAMEQHHNVRNRRYFRTDWRWVAQIMGSGVLPTPPYSKVFLQLGGIKFFPSLILFVQEYAPKGTDRLPTQVQKFKDAAFRILGLPADEPRIVSQEILPRQLRRPLLVTRDVKELAVPLEAKTEYSRRITDPNELQELIRTMSQGGEVVQNPDGSVCITTSRVIKKESIKQDELEDFLDNLPPETRRALRRHWEQSG